MELFALDGKAAVVTGGGRGIGAASAVKFVPILGMLASAVVMPVLSAGATYGIGKAFIQHFKTGGTLLDFNPPDYREFIKSQKDRWDARRGRGSAEQSPQAGSSETGAAATSS